MKHNSVAAYAFIFAFGCLAAISRVAIGQTEQTGAVTNKQDQGIPAWHRLEIELAEKSTGLKNRNAAKLLLETPTVPTVTSTTSPATGKWRTYEGGIEETGFTYNIAVLEFYGADQYDPARFRPSIVTSAMLDNWKSSSKNWFVSGGSIPVPFRNVESEVIGADFIDPNGIKLTTTYCVLKAHGTRVDISITYDTRRESNFKAAIRLLDSVRVYPDVTDNTNWRSYTLEGITLNLAEAPQQLIGNRVPKGELTHRIYTVNMTDAPSQTPMGTITCIELSNDRKLTANQFWTDEILCDLKSDAENGEVVIKQNPSELLVRGKKRLQNIVCATTKYTKKGSSTVVGGYWAVVVDGSRYYVLEFNLLPHWRSDAQAIDTLLNQITRTFYSLDLTK